MRAPPIQARTEGGSCFSRIFHFRASQFTTVPSSYRLLMPFPLEQFFAALNLRVVTILDLEPCRLCRVGTEGMLCHNALKIHFAHAFE
jgi:hypothetical protein